ncbi:hypothetical protein OSB04_001618 [Centaurea solstitialis]|uniref:Mitochondrial protein n=1 Tax=Centaurea solstitialis TaxID=347529 RepID=A0AA38WLK9_9ASTR|nr:hypothetical protein OSB04_001618 [Centaurea solstitialis]
MEHPPSLLILGIPIMFVVLRKHSTTSNKPLELVSYTTNGLFFTQAKYAHDILASAGLLDAKPALTPLSKSTQFTSYGDPFSDPTFYRSLVGVLQYLIISRPDLLDAVNQVSQFLHVPTKNHFQAVKRILWYVKGILSFGLTFQRSHAHSLVACSDADWARCIETRRSMYGYSIFLGGNIVSWTTKKQLLRLCARQ